MKVKRALCERCVSVGPSGRFFCSLSPCLYQTFRTLELLSLPVDHRYPDHRNVHKR